MYEKIEYGKIKNKSDWRYNGLANPYFAKEAPETYWKTSTDLPSFPA
ncbi:hypothetical protein, partial [Bacillus haynesii]